MEINSQIVFLQLSHVVCFQSINKSECKLPSFPDNPRQVSRVPVYIRVLDVNDNAPTFATNYETFVCENAKANQVGITGDGAVVPHRFPSPVRSQETC